MNIPLKVSQAFNKAVSNPENIQANGHVNWNYVDADVYMDVGPRDTDGNPANNQKRDTSGRESKTKRLPER